MTSENDIRQRAFHNSLRRTLNKSGIFSYAVQYDNGHKQEITTKVPLVTEGVIIPEIDQMITELPAIYGQVPYAHLRPAFQREQIIAEARAQATLAGAFHAVHKLVMGDATPQDAPINERYVPFTAVPVFVRR